MRKTRNNLFGTGRFYRRLDLTHSWLAFEIAVCNIVADSDVVVERLLEEYRYQTPQLLGGNLPKINAVDLDTATLRVIKTAQQLYQSALACAIWPNNSD